jgi:hypothetical protein
MMMTHKLARHAARLRTTAMDAVTAETLKVCCPMASAKDLSRVGPLLLR